ncbi:MAG TPA: HAD family hydrolase [Thioalkalivibrio sp.]|nr:HAD family hydrolase [Thioalkalivibrio sp.]
MNKAFDLLVFDWDGTLMDSEARIVHCLTKSIDDIGAEPRSADELRNIIGLGLAEAIRALYAEADTAFIQAFSEAYRRHFLFEDDTPSSLFPGAREVVEGLAAAGYLLAIATGKARRGLDRVLETEGLGHLFHATRCADESFSKPHPAMLEEIMVDLDTAPGRTLMIGDTEYDMLMAHNARAHGLAVSYGVHALERLLAHASAGHIDGITELPAWLDGKRRSVA